jgi:hypothetical protein
LYEHSFWVGNESFGSNLEPCVAAVFCIVWIMAFLSMTIGLYLVICYIVLVFAVISFVEIAKLF